MFQGKNGSWVPVCLAALFAAGSMTAGAAETGVTAKEVLIGMSNALSGPSSGLGTGMKEGVEAFLKKANSSGGVNGRKLKLVSLDDGYEPDRAAKNTEKLINENKVFALLGYVGTPTSTAVMPLVGKSDTPYIAPFTGAEFLRNPINKNVFNIRASYFDETEGLVERFTKDLGIKKIGIFIQDDAFGQAGESGVLRALKKRDMALTGKGTYQRNTVDIDAGLAAIKESNPEAVIFVGTYKAGAALVSKARAAGFNPKFASVSFVGTAALINELGSNGDGVIVSQVVPSPTDTSIAVVKDYQAAMKKIGKSKFDYTSLEGYIGARAMVEALKKAGKNLTRDGFRAALEKMNANLGGFKVAFSPTSHSGSSKIFFTVVKGGKAVPVTKF